MTEISFHEYKRIINTPVRNTKQIEEIERAIEENCVRSILKVIFESPVVIDSLLEIYFKNKALERKKVLDRLGGHP